MEDLKQAQEKLKGDVNQLKDQMAQMMQILKFLKKKNTGGTPSIGNGE